MPEKAARPEINEKKSAGFASAPLYWKRTSALMWWMMMIWAVAGFGIHFFAAPLNGIRLFGFPLGFYFAAQGSLLIFVVALFWFARRQNEIDRECGVAEEK